MLATVLSLLPTMPNLLLESMSSSASLESDPLQTSPSFSPLCCCAHAGVVKDRGVNRPVLNTLFLGNDCPLLGMLVDATISPVPVKSDPWAAVGVGARETAWSRNPDTALRNKDRIPPVSATSREAQPMLTYLKLEEDNLNSYTYLPGRTGRLLAEFVDNSRSVRYLLTVGFSFDKSWNNKS